MDLGKGEDGGVGVRWRDQDAGGLEGGDLSPASLRVFVGSRDRGNNGGPIGGPVGANGTHEMTGRIGMSAVANDDIQQDHARGRVFQSLGESQVALARIDHRMRLAVGVLVGAQIDHGVRVVGFL